MYHINLQLDMNDNTINDTGSAVGYKFSCTAIYNKTNDIHQIVDNTTIMNCLCGQRRRNHLLW